MRAAALGLLAVLAAASASAQNPVAPAAVNGGIYLATPPTLVDQQKDAILVDTHGNLLVNCVTGCSGGGGGSNVTIVGPFGQATMAASIPVVIASNQTAIPITGTVTATNPSVGANAGAGPAFSTQIGFQDGGGILQVAGDFNPLPVTDPILGSVIYGVGSVATSGIFGLSQANTAAPTYADGGAYPLSLTTAGRLRIDGSGATQPISGTVAATQSGTWNITNITGTVSLPTGAATAAGLTTINTTLGSPFQAGGSIGNTAFGISGTLPAFAATPTFKIDQTTPGTTNAVSVTNFPATQPVSGTVAVTQSTSPWAVGQSTASALNATVVGAGSAGAANSGVVTVQGIASMTHLLDNIFGNGGATLDATIGPATAPTNGIAIIARAQSAEPTAATNGQTMAPALDLTGKQINMPYANKENMLRGAGSSSTTGAAITVLASGGTGNFGYLTGLQCGNTSATTIFITLSDGASSIFILPAGGGTNVTFPTPLVSSSTATAITATLSANATTIYCNAQGYKGT